MFRVLLLILVVTSSATFAQIENSSRQNDVPKAYIFTELEKANNAELKKKFEEFYKELKKDSDSEGYIINYGTDKEIARREKQIRNSITFREYDSSRIRFVRGENIEKLKTVFCIIPAGATPPTPISANNKVNL